MNATRSSDRPLANTYWVVPGRFAVGEYPGAKNRREAAAKHILTTCGVGLAPSRAFGPDGEGHLRLCFAQPPETLTTALERLADYFNDSAGGG